MNKELLKKAKETKTVEELKALAAQSNFDMDDDKAEKYFAHLHSDAALGDDELDNISGGCAGVGNNDYTFKICPQCHNRVKVYSFEGDSWDCPHCGYTAMH